MTQIEQLKASKAASSENKTPNVNSEDNQVMYELMMKPDTSKMEERKKMALFESRLESLEKVLGPSQQKLVRLFFHAQYGNTVCGVFKRGVQN